jgi:hypothetical protein
MVWANLDDHFRPTLIRIQPNQQLRIRLRLRIPNLTYLNYEN